MAWKRNRVSCTIMFLGASRIEASQSDIVNEFKRRRKKSVKQTKWKCRRSLDEDFFRCIISRWFPPQCFFFLQLHLMLILNRRMTVELKQLAIPVEGFSGVHAINILKWRHLLDDIAGLEVNLLLTLNTQNYYTQNKLVGSFIKIF